MFADGAYPATVTAPPAGAAQAQARREAAGAEAPWLQRSESDPSPDGTDSNRGIQVYPGPAAVIEDLTVTTVTQPPPARDSEVVPSLPTGPSMRR